MKFENLIKELDALKRDGSALPNVLVENDKEHDDIFLITWKYPVESVIPITDNFISLTYRFKLDIHHLELLWKKKYEKGLPNIKKFIETYFFDFCKYLRDFNGVGDDYEAILKAHDKNRGHITAKEYGF